jgi:hypothetical protein
LPNPLTRTDRRILIWLTSISVLLLTVTAFLSPPSDAGPSAVPSTYSSRSEGARAALLLLQDLSYSARRWESSPEQLPASGAGTVLILAEPTRTPTPAQKAALLRFLYTGGRILFCGGNANAFLPAPELETAVSILQDYPVIYPSRVTRGVKKISLRPQNTWPAKSISHVALAGDERHAVVTAWTMGTGEVIWWAAATPLTNAGLSQADNLQLFLNSARGESVLWDEYFHGQAGSLWTYVSSTPIGWGVAQLGLIAAMIIFTYGRRRGPIQLTTEPVRLSPVEFVETVAGLYRRAGAAHVALEISYRRVRQILTKRLGMPGTSSDAELGREAAERLGMTNMEAALVRAGRGASAKISESDALSAVRDIESYTAQFK